MTTGKQDEIKGRIKESAGTLANNPELKNEGKIDRVTGKIKETVSHAVDKARNLARGH
jgi:uncharacterized protein YjbJ (UPF0337 family)